MATIRSATEADIPALASLGEAFYAVHPIAVALPCDREALHQIVHGLLYCPTACVFVACEAEEIVGGILGALQPMPFQLRVQAAYEIGWFVAEPYRRSQVATQLFDAFEAWSHAAGVMAIVCSSLCVPAFVGIAAFYARRGYAPSETIWWKDLR